MPRDKVFQVRISEPERALWQESAEKARMSLSEWIRYRCNKADDLPPVSVVPIRVLEEAVIAEIRAPRSDQVTPMFKKGKTK
jgi:hypothetical protein